MKQKTAVDEVQLGMHVSELDRAWSAVPFEPPFEVQGFVVSSESDLAQIKKHCNYVYIDIPDEADRQGDSTIQKQRVVLERVEVPGALRNVRYISPHKHLKHKQSAVVSRYSKKNRSEEPRCYKPRKPKSKSTVTVSAETWWDNREQHSQQSRRYQGEYQAGRLTIRLVDDFEGSRRREPRNREKRKLVFVESESIVPVYPIQCPVEEEVVVARDIVKDTYEVCENLVRDVQVGRAPKTDTVKQTVGGLVQSVIRNPDALTWLMKLKQQDDYTYYHSMAVCVMALTLGRHLGFPENELNSLGIGTLLQDIGKIQIPKGLLDKKGKLTSAERQVLRKHVETGIKMLDCQHDFTSDTMEIVRSHHERHDGSGYPKGVHGGSITAATTIAAMSDTFQALVSHRPYRRAKTSLDALTKMYELGDKWFPQVMVEHLIQCVGPFPIGTFVMLNTDDIAVVISPNRIQQLKPRVLVVMDSQGNRLEVPESIDLSRQLVGDDSHPWKITQVLNPEDHGIEPREFFF